MGGVDPLRPFHAGLGLLVGLGGDGAAAAAEAVGGRKVSATRPPVACRFLWPGPPDPNRGARGGPETGRRQGFRFQARIPPLAKNKKGENGRPPIFRLLGPPLRWFVVVRRQPPDVLRFRPASLGIPLSWPEPGGWGGGHLDLGAVGRACLGRLPVALTAGESVCAAHTGGVAGLPNCGRAWIAGGHNAAVLTGLQGVADPLVGLRADSGRGNAGPSPGARLGAWGIEGGGGAGIRFGRSPPTRPLGADRGFGAYGGGVSSNKIAARFLRGWGSDLHAARPSSTGIGGLRLLQRSR